MSTAAQAGHDFGLIGLAVMGQNLVLNVESRGFSVSVYNRTGATTAEFVARHPGKRITACATLARYRDRMADHPALQARCEAVRKNCGGNSRPPLLEAGGHGSKQGPVPAAAPIS